MKRIFLGHRLIAAALLILVSVLLIIGLSFFLPHPVPLERALLGLSKYDVYVQSGYLISTEAELRHALRIDVLGLAGIVLLGAGLYFARARWLQPDLGHKLFSMCMTIACSVSIFVVLAHPTYEVGFCPIETLMTNPASLPLYGHRLLLVWLADFLKFVIPALSYRRCYLATQFLATFGSTYMIGQWSALFIGRQWKFLGQILFSMMIIPTFMYCDFYDIPMVFFYSCCLFLLYKQSYIPFLTVLGIGTLNHENTLLLIPVAIAVFYRTMPWLKGLILCVGAFLVWGIAKISMQHLIPMDSHFQLGLWSNLVDLAHPHGDVIKSASTLVFWWGCAAIGYLYSDQFIRRTIILLPGLMFVTLIVGHINEARQFDAFIPVAIAIILSYLHKLMTVSSLSRVTL